MSHHQNFSPLQTNQQLSYHTPLPPMTTQTLSLQSLLREKSFLQTRLKQLQLQIEQKQYYYQQIQSKSQQNRQLYTILVRQFSEFKQKCIKISKQKDSVIEKLNQQLSTYKQSQFSFTQQLKQYQSTIFKLTEQNNRLKKEIIHKNIFIECYLKKNKQYQYQQTNKKQHSLHKKKYLQNIHGKQTGLNEIKTQLFASDNDKGHQQKSNVNYV